MPKTRKASPAPDLLPARFQINAEAFDSMQVTILPLPYRKPLEDFKEWLGEHLSKRVAGNEDYVRREERALPYRLLNNALVACAPTIVHGFEWYDWFKTYVMLAVGTPNNPISYPSVQQVALVMRAWIRRWGQRPWLKNIIEGVGRTEWNDLLQAMDAPPDTQWNNGILARDLACGQGKIAYEAVPSLIATLLHETSCPYCVCDCVG